jgi:hypothetical protein
VLYLPSFVGPASGKLGTLVASRNRGGPYLRAHNPAPADPNTAEQILTRSAMAYCTAQWQALTGAQRAAWKAFSLSFPRPNRLGQLHPTGGFQEFVRANFVRKFAGLNGATGLGLITTPPSTGTGDPVSLTFKWAIPGQRITFEWLAPSPEWATNSTAGLVLWVSPWLSTTINWYRSPMTYETTRKKVATNLTSPQARTLTVPAPGASGAIFIKSRVTNSDGRLSFEQWDRLAF